MPQTAENTVQCHQTMENRSTRLLFIGYITSQKASHVNGHGVSIERTEIDQTGDFLSLEKCAHC